MTNLQIVYRNPSPIRKVHTVDRIGRDVMDGCIHYVVMFFYMGIVQSIPFEVIDRRSSEYGTLALS